MGRGDNHGSSSRESIGYLSARSVEVLQEKNFAFLLKCILLYFCHSIQEMYSQYKAQYPDRWRAKCRHFKYGLQYGAARPNPYDLIYVDPTNIEYLRIPRFSSQLATKREGTFIVDGDWDQEYSTREKYDPGLLRNNHTNSELIRVENFIFYRSCAKHFNEGVPWEETDLYQFLMEKKRSEDLTSIDHIVDFDALDALYRDIKGNGYLHQRDLRCSRHSTYPPERDEVYINIGRDGELIFEEGKHRFTIARILGVDHLPCRVFVRQKQWQELRLQISNLDSIDDLDSHQLRYIHHPDMHDVIPNRTTQPPLHNHSNSSTEV